jgi:hypothetical protein
VARLSGARAVAGRAGRSVAGVVRVVAPPAGRIASTVVGLILGLVVAVPVAAVLAFKLMSEAFETDIWALEVLAVGVVAAATAAALWWAFTGGRIHTWLREGRTQATLSPLAVVLFASVSFAGLTILLYQAGHLELHGSKELADEDLIWDEVTEFFLWHLFDTVPLLDVPETLRWQKPFKYSDSLSGLILLGYKSLVIFPLLQVGGAILAGRTTRRA